ncbi:MAG: ISAs1 family transposase [Bacteroidales bacterium]|nr:ISAs1 family transposase [Bacteroidales bacterium]
MNILTYFVKMKDPRVERTKLHKLEDIIFIAIASVLSGVETWNEMEMYGKTKVAWLQTFLDLPNGIPTHDTFNRFFSALDSNEFENCFLDWINSIFNRTQGEIISIDGKTMRGSRNQGCKSATHIVSAWADKNELILGQIKTDEKSNEITAIPILLNALLLDGCVVTIDAMGCQKKIVTQIVSKKSDYIIAVKENQKELYEDIQDSFRVLPPIETHEDIDYGHGRIETRICSILTDLSLVENSGKWKKLSAIVRLDREKYFKSSGKIETEVSYYISSLKSAIAIESGVRKHWGIENKVHWILDVAFNEDHSRKRAGNAAENYSCLNRIALNMLRKDNTKIGIKGKRLKAGWDNDFVFKLLKNN